VAVYAILRRAFTVLPAVVGALIIWSHPIVIDQTFQARFYGTLLMAAAVFCLVYCRPRSGKRDTIVVALASILLCTIHYFGIISLAAIIVGDMLAARQTLRERLWRLLPVAAGPLTLLLFVPFLRSQSADLPVRSWVEPFSAGSAGKLVEALFRALALPTVLIFWWTSQLISARIRSTEALSHCIPGEEGASTGSLQALAGMSALLVVPFVLIGISAVVMSVLIPRYMITAVLGVTPPAALLASRTRRPLLMFGALGVAALSYLDLSHDVRVQRDWEVEQRAMVNAVRGNDELPIVTFARAEAYMICYVAPDLAPRVVILDLRPEYRDELNQYILYEYGAEQKVRRFYDMPPLVRLKPLRAMGRFHLVPHQAVEGNDLPPLDRLPLRQVEGSVYEVK
jgi:hypothetical protein